MVRLACERHIRDRDTGAERGLRFDTGAAQDVFDFFEQFLCLAEGEHAGRPFILQPFQKFILGSLFGWMGSDGYRRFRTAYIEIGKGNGKSPLAAGIGLYGLIADGEAGAEVYAAAVTRDQAKILFTDAENMVSLSPALSSRVENTVNNLAFPRTKSFFRAISSEAKALDGKRVHMALIDEIHEHPNAQVVDKMRAGTKGRRQALIFEITNSGYDRHSVCYQHHDYSEKVLRGIIENDSWFAYVCQLDACETCRTAGKGAPSDDCGDCDDWRDENVWLKANPNLDVSITRKYLREQVTEAEGMPSKQNIVKRLNFCIWTEQAVRWIDMGRWDACGAPFDAAELAGRACYMGLDLASVDDLAALAAVFPPVEEGELYKALVWFWVPEESVHPRSKRGQVPYDVWVREGLIEATPGEAINYKWIRAKITEIADTYAIRRIAYDPWNASELTSDLETDGLEMVQFRQGFGSMAGPTKQLGRLILRGELAHGGNPVLRWNASNMTVATDPAGNVKPDKAKSTEKIDGVVALIMALDGAIHHEPESTESVYETRGARVFG